MSSKIVAVAVLHLIALCEGQTLYSKLFKTSEASTSCILIEDGSHLPNFRGFRDDSVKIEVSPAVRLPEGGEDLSDSSVIIEIWSKTKSELDAQVASHCGRLIPNKSLLRSHHRIGKSIDDRKVRKPVGGPPEIRKIIDSGDPRNRIDVVFMGDGYTEEERSKFYSDVDRFVEEMFAGVTFRSYLPLFNIWAVFVSSPESGIGYDGPKNTPFRLYRQKGTLRAVFTDNPEYAREVCKLTGDGACDYPSLMGNDDYYGGLGGEFVIFTRSHTTGKIVLRHEMGHNFLVAGEEYDNGYAYFGANADRSLSNLKWSKWLTYEGKPREERSMFRILQYPWQDLTKHPAVFNFASDGRYSRWHLTVSVTAAEADSLEFLVDDALLPWNSTGVIDREFYEWTSSTPFSTGFHKLVIKSKGPVPEEGSVARMICSVSLHEFGGEEEYHTDNSFVGAYPTWNFMRRKSYRPTNAGCIMRNMTHDRFCPVCQEGMWINFLSQISLIDKLEVGEVVGGIDGDHGRRIEVKTLALGQFRKEGNQIEGEWMKIRWFKNGEEQKELEDLEKVIAGPGNWTVRAEFETPEVRSDRFGNLQSKKEFRVEL